MNRRRRNNFSLNRHDINKIWRNNFHIHTTPNETIERERHNVLATEESHTNGYDGGDSYDYVDTPDYETRNDQRIKLDVPILPDTDTHLMHNLNNAMSTLTKSYGEKQQFEKTKFMRSWEQENQTKMQTMLKLTEQSQLRPIFTKDLYKYRNDLKVVPSMTTMRLLKNGVKFGIKSAQRIQSHPQIVALTERTAALEAAKHKHRVPIAPQTHTHYHYNPSPPPIPQSQPQPYFPQPNPEPQSQPYFSQPTPSRDDYRYTQPEYTPITPLRRYEKPFYQITNEDRWDRQRYDLDANMSDDSTPHARDEYFLDSRDTRARAESMDESDGLPLVSRSVGLHNDETDDQFNIRDIQESAILSAEDDEEREDDIDIDQRVEIDGFAHRGDEILETKMYWNEQSKGLVLNSLGSFNDHPIYELLLLFADWICSSTTRVLRDDSIEVIASAQGIGELGDLMILTRLVDENLLDAVMFSQQEEYKIIPLPTAFCSDYATYNNLVVERINENIMVDEFELTAFPTSKFIFVKFNEYLSNLGDSRQLIFRHTKDLTKESSSMNIALEHPELSLVEILETADIMYQEKTASIDYQQNKWVDNKWATAYDNILQLSRSYEELVPQLLNHFTDTYGQRFRYENALVRNPYRPALLRKFDPKYSGNIGELLDAEAYTNTRRTYALNVAALCLASQFYFGKSYAPSNTPIPDHLVSLYIETSGYAALQQVYNKIDIR